MKRLMEQGPGASGQQLCEGAFLEVDPPASVKPSDDGAPGAMLIATY